MIKRCRVGIFLLAMACSVVNVWSYNLHGKTVYLSALSLEKAAALSVKYCRTFGYAKKAEIARMVKGFSYLVQAATLHCAIEGNYPKPIMNKMRTSPVYALWWLLRVGKIVGESVYMSSTPAMVSQFLWPTRKMIIVCFIVSNVIGRLLFTYLKTLYNTNNFFDHMNGSFFKTAESSLTNSLIRVIEGLFDYIEVNSYFSDYKKAHILSNKHLIEIVPQEPTRVQDTSCVVCMHGEGQREEVSKNNESAFHYCSKQYKTGLQGHACVCQNAYHPSCLKEMIASGYTLCGGCNQPFAWTFNEDSTYKKLIALQILLLPLYVVL